MSERYFEQLCRVQRYLERFRQLKVGRAHTMASDNYMDDIYAFFQTCYHLKDWIQKDQLCRTWQPRPMAVVKAEPGPNDL